MFFCIYNVLHFQVSFTGSTEVGRLIMQAAATSNLKQVSLELGGKSPILVFDDADVEKATDLALSGILFNKVQDLVIIMSNVFKTGPNGRTTKPSY